MDGLIKFWINDYFTDLLLTLALILVLIISVNRRSKHLQFKFFPLYFTSFLILQLLNYSYYLFDVKTMQVKIAWFGRYIDILVTLIELFAFTYFFYTYFAKSPIARVIKLTYIITTGISLTLIVIETVLTGRVSYSSISLIYILESLVIMFYCFCYYRTLFTKLHRINLLQDSAFWTATGLAFFSICTLPATFVLKYSIHYDYLFYTKVFTIIHVFYFLLFAMIIKSFSCKTPKPI